MNSMRSVCFVFFFACVHTREHEKRESEECGTSTDFVFTQNLFIASSVRCDTIQRSVSLFVVKQAQMLKLSERTQSLDELITSERVHGRVRKTHSTTIGSRKRKTVARRVKTNATAKA